MNAKLIATNAHGVELRRASRKAQTWPGYHESSPLGHAGYWVGNHRRHAYLGRQLPAAQYLRDRYELEVGA